MRASDWGAIMSDTMQRLRAIAGSIPADMLRLTMRTIIGDVMQVHRCTQYTAQMAVEMARARHGR